MTLINPTGLSNSGAPSFTGQKSKISKYAYNLVINGNSQYYFVENPSIGNSNINSNTNSYYIDFRTVLAQQRANSKNKKLHG
jgi:hypothetical protein